MKLVWLLLFLVVPALAQLRPLPTDPPFETTESPLPKDATYWITLSNKIRAGHPLTLNVQILSGTDPVTVILTILDSTDDTVKLSSTPTQVYPGGISTIKVDIPMDFKLPSDGWYAQYKVRVEGRGNTVSFKEETFVTFDEKAFSIFVQTDKAMYKPGQTVKFRVLGMWPDMKIVRGKPMDIVIMDSKSNKIRQYKGVEDPNGRGVVELTFNLADRVPTGEWTISVTMMEQEETKTFTVDDYVLPKFEAKLDIPPFGLTSDPMLSFTVKAKYTFGQPVTDGYVTVSINNGYFWAENRVTLYYKGLLNKDGEFQVHVSTKELLDMLMVNSPWVSSLEYQTLEIVANVTERNTGRMQSGTASIMYYRSPLKMDFVGISPQTFKPGLSYTGYLEVKKKDDTLFSPAEASKIKVRFDITYQVPLTPEEIEAEKNKTLAEETDVSMPPPLESNIRDKRRVGPGFWNPYYQRTKTLVLDLVEPVRTVPETGWITLTFDVPMDATSVNIAVKGEAPFEEDMAYLSLQKSMSPSNSYLQLTVPVEKPKVGDSIKVKATSTEPVTKLHYQVYSKGSLVLSGTQRSPNTLGSKVMEFSFVASQAMSPSMSFVVFYIRDDNSEFVVDAVTLSVDGLFQKPVTIEFSADRVQPGEEVEVVVKAEEDSLVYILAVDKSVQLLKSGNDITQDLVREELVKYDYGGFFPMWRYMFICGWPSYYGGVDASSVFESANVKVITDGLLYRHTLDQDRFPTFGGGDSGNEINVADPSETTNRQDQKSKPATVVRKFFPENWLWEISYITADSNGQVSLTAKAPDTITSWVASVFSVHPMYGLSVAKKPAVLTTFRDMFISLDLPLGIVRGEDYCFTASVFSYYKDELPILLTLDKSDHFSNIHVMRDGTSVKVSKESKHYSYFMGYLEENDIESTKYCLTPNVIGEVPVKVSALTSVPGLSDAVLQTLHVKPEGVPRSSNQPFLVDLSTGQWNQVVDIRYPPSTVKGSESITISVAGNMLGPIFDNLDDLLRMPYGCGEQNMLNFAPNIFLLEFFFTTKTNTTDRLEKAREYMLNGYQKEILYEHGDTGGFSTFGSNENTNENASLWLTAFVTKCFAQAQQLEDKYGNVVAMDTKIIARSARWMASQQTVMGYFEENGKVFNKNMQGGSGGLKALSAYTVIALHEALQVLQGDEDLVRMIEFSAQAGAQYMGMMLGSLTDPYDICITTYALHLINDSFKESAFNMMERAAITGDGLKYWKRSESLHDELTKYSWSASVDSISIEMTSYALLTYALRGIASTDGLPVVRWLTNQRGPNGGFISTQDTVIGLQALTSVATKLFSSEDIPMTISVSYNDHTGGTKINDFKISKDNEMLLQRQEIPYQNNSPSQLTISAHTDNGQRGPSTVLVMVNTDYNVKEETRPVAYDMRHEVVPQNWGFELVINVKTVTKGTNSDNNADSMSILSVTIPAGHRPDKDILAENKMISKAEEKADQLIIYFNTGTLTNEYTEVRIAMVETEGGKLAKAEPKPYSIYNYYEPDQELTKTYSLVASDFCSAVPDVGVCPYVVN